MSHGKGEHSYFICDRSGRKYPYKEGVIEPGTGLFVHKSESDGMYSAVTHPQNFPAKAKPEGRGLKHARPGSTEEILSFLTTEAGSPVTTDGEFGSFLILLED
jgi:hypothetical protein